MFAVQQTFATKTVQVNKVNKTTKASFVQDMKKVKKQHGGFEAFVVAHATELFAFTPPPSPGGAAAAPSPEDFSDFILNDVCVGEHVVKPTCCMTPGTPILDPLFSRNFGGLVLVCIEADFCDQGIILQHFSRSTKCTFLRTGRNSIFIAKFRMKFC